MNNKIIVFGAGGHATSVTNVAASNGVTVLAYVDDARAGELFMDAPVVTFEEGATQYDCQNFVVAIGDNTSREAVALQIKDACPDARFPTLLHSSSVVGISALIGEGTVVMPLVSIGPMSNVGKFCILNTTSSIDHDGHLHDFCSTGPGVVCGGNVEIGYRSAICIGTAVSHSVSVGADTVVGGHSFVNKSVPGGVLAYGSPCKTIRKRAIGESYLSKNPSLT